LAEVATRDATIRDLSLYWTSSDGDRYCSYLKRRSRAALTPSNDGTNGVIALNPDIATGGRGVRPDGCSRQRASRRDPCASGGAAVVRQLSRNRGCAAAAVLRRAPGSRNSCALDHRRTGL